MCCLENLVGVFIIYICNVVYRKKYMNNFVCIDENLDVWFLSLIELRCGYYGD